MGRLPQVPGVFSQGTTLEDLEENICDAYRMIVGEQEPIPVAGSVETKEIEVPARSGESSYANWSAQAVRLSDPAAVTTSTTTPRQSDPR